MSVDIYSTDYLHKEFPKKFKRNEFWNQIKRTVNGQQVSEHDINLIVSQIDQRLNLQQHNHLLDLGCGNAALASRLFKKTETYTGVDFSEYLLSVAAEYFKPNDNVNYIESDIRQIENYVEPTRNVDKVLIYGCIAYLSKGETASLLHKLKTRLPCLKKIFIGNVPNKCKAEEFFSTRQIRDFELNNPQSPIGVWWEVDEFEQLANELGYKSDCFYMPTKFYGSEYRFDLLLTNQN